MSRSMYYLSPDGNDNNQGILPDKPWRTIDHAVKLSLPGDTLMVQVGEHWAEWRVVNFPRTLMKKENP